MRGPAPFQIRSFVGGIQQVAQNQSQARSSVDYPHRLRGWSMKDGTIPWRLRSATSPCSPARKTREFTAISASTTSPPSAQSALSETQDSTSRRRLRVGFDDILSAAYYTPSLTTVRQPSRRWASAAPRSCSNGSPPRSTVPSEIVMAPELVVRESSGPAPGRMPTARSKLDTPAPG